MAQKCRIVHTQIYKKSTDYLMRPHMLETHTPKSCTFSVHEVATYNIMKSLAKDLTKILGSPNLCSISPSLTAHYSGDESFNPKRNPTAVAFPRHSNDVSEIHKYCNIHGIAVIPHGQGSGMEGGVNPVDQERATLTLDMMKHMNKIKQMFPSPDRYAIVQAGVTRLDLNTYIGLH